jgi:hypothetical protein
MKENRRKKKIEIENMRNIMNRRKDQEKENRI